MWTNWTDYVAEVILLPLVGLSALRTEYSTKKKREILPGLARASGPSAAPPLLAFSQSRLVQDVQKGESAVKPVGGRRARGAKQSDS